MQICLYPDPSKGPAFFCTLAQFQHLWQNPRMELTTTTAPDKPMARPTNRRHRAFCQTIAQGSEQTSAYRRFISKSSAPCFAQASNLAARYRPYIQSLRQRLADIADNKWLLSKVEAIQFATRAVRTPLSEAANNPDSDLIQERTVTETEHGTTTKIKVIDKLAAIDRISKVCGWEAPTQHQHLIAVIDSPALQALVTLKSGSTVQVDDRQREQAQESIEAETVENPDEPASPGLWTPDPDA